MKLANLTRKDLDIVYKGVVLLYTVEDFKNFITFYESDVANVVRKLFNSGLPIDRWDHFLVNSPAGITLNAAVNKCKIAGGSPFIEMDKISNEVNIAKLEVISRGDILVQQKNGSYFYIRDESQYDIDIISEDYEFSLDIKYHIGKNTKYINLENDPELEQHTKDFMKENDENFSYILNLRNCDKYKLSKIFKLFVKNGGESLYLYTTGMDTLQMRDYIQIAIDAGIKKGLFEFNAGKDQDIVDVMDEFSYNMDIEYKFL